MNQNELQEFEQARSLMPRVIGHTEEFLKAFGLTHVWVSRYYFDGRYLDLTNDISWKERMVRNNFYITFIKDFIVPLQVHNSMTPFFTWQADPVADNHLLYECFDHGILSGFNILKVCSDHVENFGFGSNKGILEVTGNLPSREELDMYCLYVRENIWQDNNLQNLILGETGQSFSLSPEPHDSKKYTTPIPKSFTFKCNNHEGRLSPKQLVYLGLFAKGYEHKDISRIVGLSHRTVEFYIQKIKRQYNNPSISELVTSFHNSSLSSVDPHLLHSTIIKSKG